MTEDREWTPEDMPVLATAIVHAYSAPAEPLDQALKGEPFKTAIMCSVDAFVTMAEHFATEAPKRRATDAMLLLAAQYFVERGSTHAQAAQQLQMAFAEAWSAVMDHVKPHRGDVVLFFDGEVQSLCKNHHDKWKQAIENSQRSACDASGMPTDPSHPWSR